MFFDDHPRFFETSKVGTRLPDGPPSPRLSNRYRGIVWENRELFDSAVVLDIGSHDGRWTLAALDMGARHVTGIEGRAETCNKAHENAGHYGIKAESYDIICDDAFAVLDKLRGPFDLILCLGFMYHTAHHFELFRQFHRLGSRVILDTKVNNDPKPGTFYMAEPVRSAGSALPVGGDTAVVGVPSRAGIRFLSEQFHFRWTEVNWDGLGVTDWRACEDYRDGTRQTYVLTSNDY